MKKESLVVLVCLFVFLPHFVLGAELRTGAGVFVFPPKVDGGVGTVLLPDGTQLNVSGSKTAGIQEAIQYASDYGWDLFIYGKGTYATDGTYRLKQGLTFPALQGKTIRIVNALLDFGDLVDPAMLFDATMMVDFKMTGTVYAPKSSKAIVFRPVSPHPLDGTLFHTSGVADSRFSFENIVAGQTGVSMETSTLGGINYSSFYFGNIYVPTGGSGVIRSGMYFTGDILDATDPETTGSPNLPDNLDYFNPQGVAVLPPSGAIGSPGRVILPSGAELDISDTQTSGIQEAIQYALSNSLDLAVYGRGLQNKYITFNGNTPSYPTNGFYQINKEITFPSFSNRTIRFYNVTLNYFRPDIVNGIVFDSVNASNFEFTGQVAGGGLHTAFYFNPTNGEGINNSLFRIGHVGNFGGIKDSTGIFFNPSTKSISNNRFLFHEILGSDFPIKISPPSASTHFSSNFVRGVHIHEFSQVGVQIGEFVRNPENVNNNNFVLVMDSEDKKADDGVQLIGHDNVISAFMWRATNVGRAISLEPKTSGNLVKYFADRAPNPVFYSPDTDKTNVVQTDQSFMFTGSLGGNTSMPPQNSIPKELVFVSQTQKNATTTSFTTPLIPPTTPSFDGTRISKGGSLVDLRGHVWTFGSAVPSSPPDSFILRDGVSAAGGSSASLLLKGGEVYALNSSNTWWKFSDDRWITSSNPASTVDTPTPLPMAPQTIPQSTSTTPTSSTTKNRLAKPTITFGRNLTVGMRGKDVAALQVFLNTSGFTVAQSGFGSLGRETDYFGNATKNALSRFQKSQKEGLVPASLAGGNGYFGPLTRSFLNKLK